MNRDWRRPIEIFDGPLAPGPARPWMAHLKEIALPASVYLGVVVLMLAQFSIVILAEPHRRDEESVLFLATFCFTTLFAVICGQLLAIARVRSWVIAICSVLMFGLAIAISTFAMQGAGMYGALFMMAFFFFPFFLWGGVYSLSYGRALAATWVPVLYGVCSAITMIEDMNRDNPWFAGEKHAIWDISTIALLAVSVLLVVLFLVFRERHFLVRWRQSRRALISPQLFYEGSAGSGLTFGGWVLLLVFGLLFAALTAFIAPYLWRSGPAEGDEGENDNPPSEEPAEGPEMGDGFGEMLEKLGEAIAEAAQAVAAAAKVLWPFLLLLLALAVCVVIAIRPLRRMLTVQHYRSGLWSVPPTQRIEHAFRLVEVAFADHDVHPETKETAQHFVERALAVVPLGSEVQMCLYGMASVRDRVAYGLGVGPGDIDTMLASADVVYAALRSRLPARTAVGSYFRRRP